MEIILLEDIETLGKAGSVVNVREGYARNFLLPKNKAIPATEANRKHLETILKQRTARSDKKKTEAQTLTAALENLDLKIPLRIGKEGKAFGAVTAAEITKLIQEQGIELDKHQLQLDSPLKEPGVYSIPVSLHPEVETKIKLTVEEAAGD
jgi:large subunit ribosomal protein L9